MDLRDEREPDPTPPTDGTEGVCRETPADDGDRSLIRWMLSLTPAERLEVLQRQVDAIEALRAGV